MNDTSKMHIIDADALYERLSLSAVDMIEKHVAPLHQRIAELEEARVADNHWIIDLQEINKNLEAQLAAANARAEDATQWARKFAEQRDTAEADAARLRDVLTKVEEWFAGENGPIYRLWEDTDICNYDNRDCDYGETLAEVRDFNIPVDCLGYGTEWPAVTLYREILIALRTEEQPAESEGE